MKHFTFCVFETVTLEKIYVVKAETLDEAREKAERGETLREETERELAVSNREVIGLLETADAE